ncbi:hypothetical protein [Pseudolactococcus carnosus]|uniref:Uncharacterized protein n=1 Tax=Pseudolactococcus carnosus TaxID=2749961 RepID=A0ABT0AVI6_9LACT|nr:hypothetical protein [Lactococcus carnosus]SCA92869.1 hypothetical protein LP2241_50448 [Lactococcus piscium]MCJ1969146.1 hypothetical protein [Lactococcus carnosus]MCJ1974948.1 hypothetical protein [Lactococcus carnosus]MCJ1985193.1 hypothetical protein [Lactococcus carnosus]MCJ1986673.1 hypothetical protein [Lactococcus carnosus]
MRQLKRLNIALFSFYFILMLISDIWHLNFVTSEMTLLYTGIFLCLDIILRPRRKS